MTTVCAVKDCSTQRIKARGLCGKHYHRWERNGDPLIAKCAPNGTRKKHPLYSTYTNMKARCENKNNNAYKWYGARGITVCDRWQGIDGFDNFVTDMGERPTGRSLDRINNDDNYSPENCRWATAQEQSDNKRLLRSNNTSGYPGVTKTRWGMWQVTIHRNGVRECLGNFKDFDIAVLNRKYAEATR